MRKNSKKNSRINSEVMRELSRIIRNEIKDPRISPMVSVTDAVVAPDLKTCKAYISVLGTDEEKKKTLEGLKAAGGFIRRELANGVNLRNTPEIRFILDESIEIGVHMSKIIDDVAEQDQRSRDVRADEEPESGDFEDDDVDDDDFGDDGSDM